MADAERKKVAPVLCPFLERECTKGEETARFCHRLLNSNCELVDDYSGLWVDCFLATKMFSLGRYPFN